MEAAVGGRPRTGFARWAALSGAVYVLLFVVGTIVLFSGAKGGDDPPATVIKWYSDSGHRDRVNFGWILIGLSIFFLLWFIAALRRAVNAGDPDGILTSVVTIGGSIYAALALVAVALNDGIRTMSDDTFQHRVYPELIHAADDAGWVIHASGAAGLAAMIIAASYVFFPQFLFLLWILVVSVLMFLRPAKYEPVTTM